MSPSDDLLTIARFAQLARLSVKQLRRYDELGLLAPARTDAETGYRLYHPSQAHTAVTIALLRELDVPLAVVEELLVADEQRVAELLEAERARRASELQRVSRALAGLTALAAEGTLPEVDVDLRVEAPRRLAVLRFEAPPDGLAAATADAAARLAQRRTGPDRPFVGVFPLELSDPVRALIGVDAPDPVPGTQLLDLPAGAVARATHRGGVDTVALTWFPLLAWVHARGLTPSGDLREEYVADDLVHLTVPLEDQP